VALRQITRHRDARNGRTRGPGSYRPASAIRPAG